MSLSETGPLNSVIEQLENKTKNIEGRLDKIRLPNRNAIVIENIEKRINRLSAEMPKLKKKQPDCAKYKKNYEKKFRAYKRVVEHYKVYNDETIKNLRNQDATVVRSLRELESTKNDLEENREVIELARSIDEEQVPPTLIDTMEAVGKKIAEREETIKALLEETKKLNNKLQSLDNALAELTKDTHEYEDFKFKSLKPPYSGRERVQGIIHTEGKKCTKCGKIK